MANRHLTPWLDLGLQQMTFLLLLLAWHGQMRFVEGIGMKDPIRFVDILNSHQSGERIINVKEYHSDVQELYLRQRLDHFAPTQGHEFSQRYFYSDRFAVASHAQQYAFLCVGGEGPAMDESVLVDSVHCTGDMLELASILHSQLGFSVHLFALEHRYYGNSYPEFKDNKNQSISPVTNENLVYLSSRQALADLAHFIEIMTLPESDIRGMTATSHGEKVPPSCKWVTFGGSYPGMLAGWARLKYPHLVHAAVSNSAPIQAEVDFPEYNDRVAFDLRYDLIGGSPACLHVFQEGHAQLDNAIRENNTTLLNKVSQQFNLCDVSSLQDPDNAALFIGDGVFLVPAQSNDPACRGQMCNIERMCSYAEEQRKHNSSAKDSWEILADIGRVYAQNSDNCQKLDWTETLDYLASPEVASPGLRSWLWQTCTEFGFYQTCEYNSDCPYGKGYHPVQKDLEICSYAFGISGREVFESIQQTLEYYGDHRRLKGGSRILSVNGDVDPWSTLARVSTGDVDGGDPTLLPVYNAAGASHHFWTHKVQETDGKAILETRTFIYRTIMDWLDIDASQILHVKEAPFDAQK